VKTLLILALFFGGLCAVFEIVGIVIHQAVNIISNDAGEALLYFLRDRGNNPSEFSESYWGKTFLLGMITTLVITCGFGLYIGIGGWIKRNIQLAKEGVKVKITL